MDSQEFKAQGQEERPFQYQYRARDFAELPRGGAVDLEKYRLEVIWQARGIVRVVAGKKEEFSRDSTPAVSAEVKSPEVTYEKTDEKMELSGPDLTVTVCKSPFQINFYDKNDELIHADVPGSALGSRRDEFRACKELRTEERIYGLGEKTGFLDKKGKTYRMWNTDEASPHVPSTDPLYVSIPFYIGFKPEYSYGIFFDNSYPSSFDVADSRSGQLIYTCEGGNFDYYFYAGPELAEVVKKHTWLTGRHPLPPLWSLGYHQSRYSYYPESEVRELASRMEKENIPCDAIHLDIHYMDGFRVFTWDEQRFPDPKTLAEELSQSGINLINIIDPGVKKDPEYDVYREGIKEDYFLHRSDGEIYTGEVWPGKSVFPDFTREEVQEWWKELHENYLEQGVRGFWNDMNEPADFNERGTLPNDVLHENDGDADSHRRFHNLYALLEAKATRKAIREQREERPFVLSRAGFAGIQRQAAIWTGDNRSFWQHLEMNVPMLANLGMSGVGFCGSDVGGFSDDCSGELLARWTQLGALMPFFRNHTCIGTRAQEPWAFGEPFTSIIRRYIEFRYRLLPHIYSLFYLMSREGMPVWRPPVWHYPEDDRLHNINDQIMVGESMLAAPVCRPDCRERRVYLPEGGWYNYWTGDYYRGGQSWVMEAPLERMPLFIKENSVIFEDPDPDMQAPAGGFERLRFKLFPGRVESRDSTHLYLDDGISFDYQEGEYDLYEVQLVSRPGSFTMELEAVHAGFSDSPEKIELVCAGLEQPPEQIKLNGDEIGAEDYTLQKGKLTLFTEVKLPDGLKLELKI